MTPSILAALLLITLSTGWSAAPGDAWAQAFQQAMTRARSQTQTLYISHEAGQKTLDLAVQLPNPPQNDTKAAQAYGSLKSSLTSARDVQEGCAQPCSSPADITVYRQKVKLVATQLGLDATKTAKAEKCYIPEGKPRLKKAGGVLNPLAQSLEAEAVAEILRKEHLSPQMRAALNQRAISLANALGKTQMITADASGLAVLPTGQKARLTPEQIVALNKVPRAQADYLRKLATAPPPPTREQLQEKALDEMEAEIKANPGRVRQAQNYWKSVTDRKAEGFLDSAWKGYAYFNRGLLAISGLGDVEDSAARFGYTLEHKDVSGWRAAWEATKLAGNSALFAANFIGVGSAGKVVKGAKALDNPVAVSGLKTLSKETAEAAVTRVDDVNAVVKTALGGKRNYKAATEAMETYAKEHLGDVFKVERESRLKFWHWGKADWIAKDSKVFYNPMFGEAHEFSHAHQMFATRAAALEIVGKGKPIVQMTAGEVDDAFKLAKNLETAYYAQYEAQALRSAGFLGLAPGKAFPQKLVANTDEILLAFNGAPKWNFTRGQKAFGALSGLGSSQTQIGASLLPILNVPYLKEQAIAGSTSVGTWLSIIPEEQPNGSRQ